MEQRRIKELRKQYAISLLQTRKEKADAFLEIVDEVYADWKEDRSLYKGNREKKTPTHESVRLTFSAAGDLNNDRPFCEQGALLLLKTIHERGSILEDFKKYAVPLGNLASRRFHWIRPPETWRPTTHNVRRQFASLIRHLFARYDVPSFMDEAWERQERFGVAYNTAKVMQDWFIHIGTGHNIRTADKLPIKFTKCMAHEFINAPEKESIFAAMRYAQVKCLGGTDRLVHAINQSTLSAFHNGEEEFWESVIRFFIAAPMFDYAQVGPLIDFIRNQKYVRIGLVGPPHPNFTMKGRTIDTLMNQMEVWHRQINRSTNDPDAVWPSCEIPGFQKVEGTDQNQRTFEIKELLSTKELRAEGKAMHHCVGSYAHSCIHKRSAIYSMTKNGERMVTIEVSLKDRMIVQVRRKYNALMEGLESRILSSWAAQVGMKTRGALDRYW
jgi:hypothetical protein